MGLQDQVNDDWKAAMKARDPKKDVLSSIRTELKNKAIETRSGGDQSTTIDDEAALEVLGKMAKQRKEAITEYTKGGRDDLVEQESFELKVIEAYLPKPMSDDELRAVVKEVAEAAGATSMKEMGKVMGQVMPKVKGKADGGRVQAMVKELLS